MEYQVSARKWRPQNFDEVVGQIHVARTLTNAIRERRIAQAYLFSGMRGVGKTTMARILAKALNCQSAAEGPVVTPCQTCASCQAITAGHSPDVIEIDGASNRGIDEVRELREAVKYAPMGGRRKIYIIDEVHMLTKEAFNALLKTLEEPPPHVVFVFATTEDHKIPTTVLSRCQHFHFKRITRKAIVGQLERIIQEEGIRLTGPGLGMIAKAADGSLRDALSLLDQAIAYGGEEIKDSDLQVTLGAAGRGLYLSMIKAILSRETAPALLLVKELADQGMDPRQFTSELIEYFRHLVVAKSSGKPEELIDLPSEEVEEIRQLASGAGIEELQRLFGVFSLALESFRGAVHPGFILEMAVIRATRIQPLESFEKLLERLRVLEKSLEGAGSSGRFSQTGPLPGGSGSSEKRPDLSREAEVPSHEPSPPEADADAEAKDEAGDRLSAVDPVEQKGPIDPGEVKEQWDRVLKRVYRQRPNLGSYLEKGTVQEIISGKGAGDTLVLGYDDGSAFLVDFVQKEENRPLIASALEEVFQRPVHLKAVRIERSESEKQKMRLKKDQQEQEHRHRIKQETLAHPLVKEALDILGGDVIDIQES